jgi:hypothetical protein
LLPSQDCLDLSYRWSFCGNYTTDEEDFFWGMKWYFSVLSNSALCI